MTIVYFDGKCGLCSKEIRYYQKIAPKGVFEWQDIAHDAAPLKALNISQADALRLLHASDKTGKMHIGVDAFILIWNELSVGWRLYLCWLACQLSGRFCAGSIANSPAIVLPDLNIAR